MRRSQSQGFRQRNEKTVGITQRWQRAKNLRSISLLFHAVSYPIHQDNCHCQSCNRNRGSRARTNLNAFSTLAGFNDCWNCTFVNRTWQTWPLSKTTQFLHCQCVSNSNFRVEITNPAYGFNNCLMGFQSQIQHCGEGSSLLLRHVHQSSPVSSHHRRLELYFQEGKTFLAKHHPILTYAF